MNTTYEHIKNLRHTLPAQSPLFKKVDKMWQAITDWVDNVPDTDAFLAILRQEVQQELTIVHLEHYRRHCSGPHVHWKGEAVIGLVGMFDFYPEAHTLEEVFDQFILELPIHSLPDNFL
jgi:hypothetical protein